MGRVMMGDIMVKNTCEVVERVTEDRMKWANKQIRKLEICRQQQNTTSRRRSRD